MSKAKSAHKHQSLKERRRHKSPVWRKWAPLALGGLAVVMLGLLVMTSGGSDFAGAGGVNDFSATTLTGEDVRLVDYRGQVVMLNFWATWCPPCRAEMPTIQAVYSERQAEGFEVLAINNAEGPSLIQPFVDSLGLSFPIVMDQNTRLQRTFDIRSYPTSIFIDAAGEVYATHTGLLTEADLTRYIDQGMARETAS